MTKEELLKRLQSIDRQVATRSWITIGGDLGELMDEIRKEINQESLPTSNVDKAAKEYASTQLGNKHDVYFSINVERFKAFKAGAEWRQNNLWKSADGDELPELEREVVVFTQNFPNDAGIMKVGIAHRPNPNGWDGRNILTGEVNHYTPKTYGKGGWSLPDVKIWLDCNLPLKEGGEE